MRRGYKAAGLLLIVVVIAAAAFFVVVALGSQDELPADRPPMKPAAAGLYTEQEAERLIGYSIRKPSYLPEGLKPTNPKLQTNPSARQVILSYSTERSLKGVSLAVAPRGKLVSNGAGLNKDVRTVKIHGKNAELDTWDEPSQYNPQPGPFRMLSWRDSRFQYQLLGGGYSDEELQRIANSLPQR